MTEMFAPSRFGTQLVEAPQDWQHFESLLRDYATTDLDQPHLSSIWMRGKGGSKVLIRRLLQLAQAGGYDQAVLSTWQHNTTGLALYKALGFVPVPSFKSHPNSELIFLGRMLNAADAQASP